MSKFKINSELLIGESSDIDAIFLPVHLDEDHHADLTLPWGSGDSRSSSQDQQLFMKNAEACGSAQKAHNKEVHEEDDVTGSSNALMHAIITDTPDSNDWCYRATLTSVGVIVIIVAFLVFGHRHIRSVLLWLEQVDPALSVSVLAGLFVVICFPIAWGLSLLMVTSGYLYGYLYGPLVVTFCVTLGLSISTPAMRLLCSNYLRAHFYSRKVEAIINIVSGPHGMKIIALTRLTPIPFGLQNALFSLSSISLLRYLVSSAGGLVPMTVLNCYMGSTLRNMQDLMSDDANRLTGFFIFGGQILITVILLWFVVRKARVELKKAMDESDMSYAILPNGDCSKTIFVDHV